MKPKKLLISLTFSLLLLTVVIPTKSVDSQDLDSLLKTLDLERNSKESVNKILSLSKEHLNANPNKSLYFARKAFELAKRMNMKTSETDALYQISVAYKDKGQLDSAFLYNIRSQLLCESLSDENRMADIHLMQGTILFRYKSPDTARISFLKSLNLYNKLGDSVGIANSLNGIGAAFMRLSNYDSAISYFHQVIDISEQIDHLDGLSKAYLNIGIAYTEIPDLNLAEEYLLRSIPISKSLNKKRFIALAYNNLGTVAQDQMNLNLAFEYYRLGYEIYEELGNKLGMANVTNHLGNIYVGWEKYDKAIIEFTKARSLFHEIGDKDGYISAFHNIGTVYLETKEYNNALEIFDSCLRIAQEINSIRRTKDLYNVIHITHALNNQFEDAYNYFLLYEELKDSVFNIERSNKISELEVKYEKEKDLAYIYSLENENLQKDLKLRIRTNQRNIYLYSGIGIIFIILFVAIYFRLKARKDKIILDHKIQKLEDEKKVLAAKSVVEGQEIERKRVAQELHDGLGVLLSTASIHFTAIKDEKPKNKELINKATKLLNQATGSVREISHNIMPGLLTKLGFFEAIEDLIEKINDTEDLVATCNTIGERIRFPENLEIMLYRIVQELVNNTLKHANAHNIILDLIISSEQLIINYIDDGAGFDFNKELEKKTIGLQSIMSRINFLNGKFKNNSMLEGGVNFDIKIPIK
jgi:signal transduction histidine kinase